MSVAQAQRRNPEQVAILSADLQPRYEPNFAWKGMCGLYQSLPALRGFWPCSSQINTTQGHYLPDIATNFHCTGASTPQWGYDDLIPYVEFDGEDDAFYYADNAQFDITGTEANVVAAQRGLTLGAWVYPTNNDEAWRGIITKWGPYGLFTIGARAYIGTTTPGGVYASSPIAMTLNNWHLVIGRYEPSITQDIYQDNVKTTNAVGIPAALGNSAVDLYIGAFSGSTYLWIGKISMAFICASALSDSIIEAIWQQTRAMYGR